MDSPLLEIALLLFLILLNGFFALAEIALISARKSRLQKLADSGNQRAKTALYLATHPDRLLATVQIGVTVIGIFAGAFSGATLAPQLADLLSRVPALAPYAGSISVTVVVVLLTFFTLVLGELTPKQLALNYADRVAIALAHPMEILSRIASPLVRFLSASSNLVLRLLGVRSTGEPPVSEEEIKVLIEQGTRAGVFEEAEQEMVEGVFRLGEQRVGALMTPRPDIDWIDLDDPPEVTREKILRGNRTRFPVANGDLDKVVGVLRTRDLLACGLACEPEVLLKLLHPPVFIPETSEALQLLERFRRTGTHFALVTDEFGSVAGLITSTDLLEAIVGDMPAPGEESGPEIVRREDGSWLLGGSLSIDEMEDLLDFELPHDEDEGTFQTVGGLMMSRLGEIPETGDHFELGGYRFEVVDMDGRRVDKVLVARTPNLPATEVAAEE